MVHTAKLTSRALRSSVVDAHRHKVAPVYRIHTDELLPNGKYVVQELWIQQGRVVDLDMDFLKQLARADGVEYVEETLKCWGDLTSDPLKSVEKLNEKAAAIKADDPKVRANANRLTIIQMPGTSVARYMQAWYKGQLEAETYMDSGARDTRRCALQYALKDRGVIKDIAIPKRKFERLQELVAHHEGQLPAGWDKRADISLNKASSLRR